MDFYRNFGRNTSWRSNRTREIDNTNLRSLDRVNHVQSSPNQEPSSSMKTPRFTPLRPCNTDDWMLRDSRANTAIGVHQLARGSSFGRPKTSYPEVERPPPFPRNFRGRSFLPGRRDVSQDARRPQTAASFSQSPISAPSPPPTKGPIPPRVDIMTIPEESGSLSKGTVRVTRLDAWTRFLAYEASFQVCLQAFMDGVPEADFFMKDNCRSLKQVLQVSEMLLHSGTMIDERNVAMAPLILWDDSPIGTRRGSMFEQGFGNSPTSSRMPSPPRRRSPSPKAESRVQYKIRLERVVATPGSATQHWPSRSSYQRDAPQVTSVCVNNTTTGQYFYTFVDENGYEISQTNGRELIVECDQVEGVLTIDLYAEAQRIGCGSTSINSLVDGLVVGGKSNREYSVPTKTTPKDPVATCLPFLRPMSGRRNTRHLNSLDDEETISPAVNHGTRQSWNTRSSYPSNPAFPHAAIHQRPLHRRTNERSISPTFHQQPSQGRKTFSNSEERCVKQIQVLDENNCSIGVTCYLAVERTLGNDSTGQSKDKEPSGALSSFLENGLTAEEKENDQNTLNTCVRVTGNMAFEFLLGCVLRHENCGSHKLTLEDPWDWLVKHYVNFFGIRQSFVHLTTIKWILRPDVRSCTTHCLGVLLEKYSLLCQERDNEGLQADETTAMNLVSKEIKELLSQVFENYYLLSDLSKSGIQDGASRLEKNECPPSALRPALTLIEMMTDMDDSRNHVWLRERFKAAAHKKYQRLEALCDEEKLPMKEEQAETSRFSESNRQKTYQHIGRLASALQAELETDQNIQDCGFLPAYTNLPAITGSIFAELFLRKLDEIFVTMAPRELTNEGVDMFIKIRELQEYLESSGTQALSSDSPRDFNVFEIFEPFVSDWLLSVESTLQTKRIQLSELLVSPGSQYGLDSIAGRHKVSPLVTEMLILVESEMDRFERVIRFWQELGVQLECVVSHVLRDLICIISEQNGMTLVTNPIYSPFKGSPNDYRSGGYGTSHGYQRPQSRLQTPNNERMWQRPQSPSPAPCFRLKGIDYREAVLLNSLRYLLGVVPDLEAKLRSWCKTYSHAEHSSRRNMMEQQGNGPEIGAQFAQVVKELRTEYSHATVHCCERMAEEITQHPQHMIGNILYEASSFHDANLQDARGSWEHTPFNVDERMTPLFETLTALSEDLEKAVDPRVLVTLLRGLWEHLGEDLYIFVENLHEGHDFQDAWRCRQNAKLVANALNEWFCATMTHLVGHELASKDLDLPLHASMTQKLLADNSSALNVSYTVF